MRMLSPAVAGLVVMAFAAPTASAQAPTEDSVVGTARDCLSPDPCPSDPMTITISTTLTADARSGPAGQEPSGTMTWDEGGFAIFVHNETRVTCLSVTDRTAIVGVTGTRTLRGRFGTILASIVGFIRVTDGGGPNSGMDTFEFAIQEGPTSPPNPPPPLPFPGPTDCSSFPAGSPGLSNEQGDLVVTDAPPLPTSKDQCKNGGWQSYGVFKNQGDCVSFVRHQARQACIFERVAHGVAAFRAKYGRGPHQRHAMRRCVRQRTGP
jgi:hypothetical protein